MGRGRGGRPPREPDPLLDPEEAEAELDGPAVVRSGHTLDHGLLVRDRSGVGLAIATNGGITASVVDPATGEVVGWAGSRSAGGRRCCRLRSPPDPRGAADEYDRGWPRVLDRDQEHPAARDGDEDEDVISVASGFFGVTVRPWRG